MKCVFAVSMILFYSGFVSAAEGKNLRAFGYTNSSYESGSVVMRVDSQRQASVNWSRDLFRKPPPKTEPWKKQFLARSEVVTKIFALLDSVDFTQIGNGRAQIPDEPSVTFTESKDGKVLHSATFPSGEVSEKLRGFDPLINELYLEAKAH